MKKSLVRDVLAAVVFLVIASPAFATGDAKSTHAFVHRRHARDVNVQPYATGPVAPRVLDHKDPTRPGGIDPSFNPPPT
jgi:hypothetical protein